MRTIWIASYLVGVGLASACGHTPTPTGQLETTAAAIRAAQEAGAPAVPQGALHLQMAKDQMSQANDLINHGDVSHGSYLLMRAQADAELAVALAHQTSAQQAAQQATDRVRTLNQSNP